MSTGGHPVMGAQALPQSPTQWRYVDPRDMAFINGVPVNVAPKKIRQGARKAELRRRGR